MALNFNGLYPKKILFNNSNVIKLVYNNIVVWKEKVVETISGISNLILQNNSGDTLLECKIHGNTDQIYRDEGGLVLPSPYFPSKIEGVGDLVVDTEHNHYGEYLISINMHTEDYSDVINVYLDRPLYKGDYLDFQNRIRVCTMHERVLTGYEDWVVQTINGQLYYAISKSELGISEVAGSSNVLSNAFRAVSTNTDIRINKMYVGDNYIYFNFNGVNNTLNNFEDYLLNRYRNGNPILLMYPSTEYVENINLPELTTIEGDMTFLINTKVKPENVEITYNKNKV